jgi:hydroxymethylpyrimidine/phosphomethylpyrimidine kinase
MHAFVQGIADGTLPKESFIHYMKQDYLFLQTYARAHGLGAFKARTMAESKAFADIVTHIAHESQLHIKVRVFLEVDNLDTMRVSVSAP